MKCPKCGKTLKPMAVDLGNGHEITIYQCECGYGCDCSDGRSEPWGD